MDSRPSDEMPLLAVAERDMGAFRTLYERHADWLAIRLARRCNDRLDGIVTAVGSVKLTAAPASTQDQGASGLPGRPAVLARRPSMRVVVALWAVTVLAAMAGAASGPAAAGAPR